MAEGREVSLVMSLLFFLCKNLHLRPEDPPSAGRVRIGCHAAAYQCRRISHKELDRRNNVFSDKCGVTGKKRLSFRGTEL